MGPDPQGDKEVTILGKCARYEKEGLEYEADPRHVEIMLAQLELADAKEVVTPGAKEEGRTRQEHENLLNEEKTAGAVNNVESMTGADSRPEDTLKLTLKGSHSPALLVRKHSQRGST